MSTVIYTIFSFTRVIPSVSTLGKPFSHDLEAGLKKQPTLFGSANADSERRRALALRTLEVRLQQEQVVPPIAEVNVDNCTEDNATSEEVQDQ